MAQILASGAGGHFVCLDFTGTEERPLPPLLAAADRSWKDGPFWDDWMINPLDAIAERDQSAVVGAFIAATKSGMSSCVVESYERGPIHLTLWNQLSDHDCIIVVAVPVDVGPTLPDQGTQSSAPRPLRLVYTLTVNGLISSIDDATRTVLGWDDSVIGTPILGWEEKVRNDVGLDMWAEMLSNPSRSFRARLRLRCANGSWRWFDTTLKNLLETEGHVHVELIDITEHLDQRPDVDPMVGLCDELANRSTDAVLYLDDTLRVLACNDAFTALTHVDVDRVDRCMKPAPRVIAEPLRRVALLALASHDPHASHEAFVAHANFRLRLVATQGQFGQRRMCTIVAYPNHSSERSGGLPKGIAASTLETIVTVLQGASAASLDTAEIAEISGLSQVSVRRYIGYLVKNGQVEVHRHYGAPGRPRQTYSPAVPGDRRSSRPSI